MRASAGSEAQAESLDCRSNLSTTGFGLPALVVELVYHPTMQRGDEVKRFSQFVQFFLFGLLVLSAQTARANDPCGRWCGTWCSSTNGHQGQIHAHVCPIANCTYHVRFAGTFLGVVPFAYAVPMIVTGQAADGTTYLSGQPRLPLFGDFCCNAAVKGGSLTASYSSTKDQGQFTMERR